MKGFPSRQLFFRLSVTLAIMFALAAIHIFRLGSYFDGELYLLYYSYASDFMIPFGFYFLLGLNEIQLKFLRSWVLKSGIVFIAMAVSELAQYFDMYFFGTTFDPIDFLMFAFGVAMAALIDKQLFERYLSLWRYNYG